MALFFDGEWFDARLAAVHLSRGDVARALGINDEALGEIWKDQRELSAKDVTILAALLAVSPQDIARHAGISTPVPSAQPTLAELAARLEKVEADVAQLRARLADAKSP
jgi:transcriptional regulator with XRE-family HTH domain